MGEKCSASGVISHFQKESLWRRIITPILSWKKNMTPFCHPEQPKGVKRSQREAKVNYIFTNLIISLFKKLYLSPTRIVFLSV
jgi:hypothetical protein